MLGQTFDAPAPVAFLLLGAFEGSERLARQHVAQREVEEVATFAPDVTGEVHQAHAADETARTELPTVHSAHLSRPLPVAPKRASERLQPSGRRHLVELQAAVARVHVECHAVRAASLLHRPRQRAW